MTKRIAINGFGRIGRLAFRNLLQNDQLEVVAINDLTKTDILAHLLKYDTAQGRFPGTVETAEGGLNINGKFIRILSERNPEDLPWKDMQVDIVLECTGIFRTKDAASKHITAGAQKVIISAPAKGEGVQTIVLGINDDTLDMNNNVFSNASCTTNCFAPVAKLVDDNWGVVAGSMTTIHSYTSDQRIQDAPHADLRRSRAAAQNILPTSTGAAIATSKVVPSVAGKISAIAFRVPVVTGSIIEFNCVVEKSTTAEQVNATFKQAADGPLKNIMEFQTDPIVSSDIVTNPHSSIFDSLMTEVNGNMIKVVSWYDNEAGYSARIADLTGIIASKLS